MNHEEAVKELNRQLSTGEATRQQYEEVIAVMEGRMAQMHLTANYDVIGYMTAEATANAYREALGLPKSDISARVSEVVSPTMSDPEYQAAVTAAVGDALPKPKKGSGYGKRGIRYDEECETCGRVSDVCNWCGHCEKHCTC